MQNFKIEENLEILIPTYNRKKFIQMTLKSLLSQDSPVRFCSITVLDNASDDGASEVIAGFVKNYKNVKHIRHARNIGWANIACAYELAKAPYVWVVCDDDSFKWDAWPEIENALKTNEYDLLLTRKQELKNTSDIAKIFRQCSFLPSCIYRTALISNGVMMNMYNNVPFMFPQLALACEVFNKQGRIFLPQGEILDQCSLDTKNLESYTRGNDRYKPEYIENMFWTPGFLMSLQMIKDKKLRNYLLGHFGKRGGFFGYILGAFRKNYTRYGGYKLNEDLIRSVLDYRHRLEFDFACLFLKVTSFFRRKKEK